MHKEPPFGEGFPRNRNISGTIPPSSESATIGIEFEELAADGPPRCAYIAAETWQAGAPPPFCSATAQPGSAYCAAHARLCAVDPASRQGARIAFEQDLAARASPPPALKHLAAYAVPEAMDEEGALEDPDLLVAIESNGEGA